MIDKRSAAAIIAIVAAGLLAVPSWAQDTQGRYLGTFDMITCAPDNPQGIAAPFGANRNGMASAVGNYVGGYSLGPVNPGGYYSLTGVVEGIYTLAFANAMPYPRLLYFGLNTAAHDVCLKIRNTPDYFPAAGYWIKLPKGELAQQFQALGPCVTSITAKAPGGIHGTFAPPSGLLPYATIHQGDANGPQIGPARYFGAQGPYDGFTQVKWSAGEVPTVPGQYYTVKFHSADSAGIQLFTSRSRNLVGNDFYGGKTWLDGVENSDPLQLTIGMDNDGISTTLNTTDVFGITRADSYSQTVSNFPGNVMGQTFTATGSSVLGGQVTINGNNYVQNWLTYYAPLEIAVFQSPGVDGTGVNQIGPTRIMQSKPDGVGVSRVTFAWAPGEVPVTSGQQYYMRYRIVTGYPTAYFNMICTTANEYLGGQVLIAGVPQAYDEIGSIWCEQSPGSATQEKVVLANKAQQYDVDHHTAPECTNRTTTTALIEWSTPGSQSTAKIEYAPGNPPYTNTVNDTTPATVHSVNLTNLVPGTEYHVRVTAAATGKRSAISRDFAFVTLPQSANKLTNPSFETGAIAPWVKYGRQLPDLKTGNDVGGISPHEGTKYVGRAHNVCCTNPSALGGVYQRVAVTPGKPLTFRGWLYTFQGDGGTRFDFSARIDRMCTGRVGIDPTGGTDPASINVVWSRLTSGQDWFNPGNQGPYVDLAVTATPTGGFATVFAEAGQMQMEITPPGTINWLAYSWDDFNLSENNAAVVLNKLGEVKNTPNGTTVSISNVICTTNNDEIGTVYVEAPDRSAGVRVETIDAITPGESVKVTGTVSVKPSGERYLANATIQNPTSSTIPTPLGAKNMSIGPNYLSNVGLLMRTWGKITSKSQTWFKMTDGSSGGDIKVLYPYSDSLTPGMMLEVTGIVQLEGLNPNSAIPVLTVRSPADLVEP